MKPMRWAIAVACLVGCASPEGGMQDEPQVQTFTLRNAAGLTAKLTNHGALLMEMHVPGRDGKTADVTLGFDTVDEYLKPHPFFGVTAGRVANRIGNASFTLDGK